MPKLKSISDKISASLEPQKLLDPEDDNNSAEETIARINEYDLIEEYDDNFSGKLTKKSNLRNNKSFLSEIRKKNIKLLNDVDKKYSGEIILRKELDLNDELLMNGDDGQEADSEESNFDEVHDLNNDNESGDDEVEDDRKNYNKHEKLLKEKNSNFKIDQNCLNIDESGITDGENDDNGREYDDQEENDNKIDLYNDMQNTVKPVNTGGDIHKGFAIQHQLKVFEKLLETRIHLQKILLLSNGFPSPERYNKFIIENKLLCKLSMETNAVVEKIFTDLYEIQETLIKKYPETADLKIDSILTTPLPEKRKSTNTNSEDNEPNSKLVKYSDLLQKNYNRYRPYCNQVIQKWYDRTKMLTPGKYRNNNTDDYGVLQKIEGILQHKTDLIRKTQLYKGNYELWDQKNINLTDIDNDQDNSDKQIYSPENYDDNDFYHSQLRELIEFKSDRIDNPSEITGQFIELQKLRNNMKKIVDTRASKGRKIRYAVHHKVVNFMAPNNPGAWTNDTKSELYSSLFQ